MALAVGTLPVLVAQAPRLDAGIPALDPGWVREGPLTDIPVRTSDRLPLSDQGNRGGWILVESLSDEFSGERPDESKWWLTNPTWPGRAPSSFDAANVSLRDGAMILRASAQLAGEAAARLPSGFTHSAAFVRSRRDFLYGYAEIRAKIAASTLTSAFFLIQTAADVETEIDVFEMAGADAISGRRMGMSRHVMKLPGRIFGPAKHPRHSAYWYAPFRFSEGWHVFGLEWSRDLIAWYVDGVVVHRAKNEHHNRALKVVLDLEAQEPFLANPREDLLPATYEIDYVRTWTRGSREGSP